MTDEQQIAALREEIRRAGRRTRRLRGWIIFAVLALVSIPLALGCTELVTTHRLFVRMYGNPRLLLVYERTDWMAQPRHAASFPGFSP